MKHTDVAIIGGGIVGLATALALVRQTRARIVVLEAEADIGRHQTGHNSGVIHSGLYYKPGSHKARNCVEGRAALIRFCQEHAIPFELCGKLVVATTAAEMPALEELCRRGAANGLSGLRRLSAGELRDIEPHASGIAALHVPETGIVDFRQVAGKYAELVQAGGGAVVTQARLVRVESRAGELVLTTAQGEHVCRYLVNCGGLQSDRIARLCGLDPGLEIIPFRGEYYALVPQKRSLVRGLIYPVPDPRFPFLGVHFTRTIHGEVEAGPNAVLAFRREGYRLRDVSPRDLWQMICYRGFWRMAARYGRMGLGEFYRSLSKRVFHQALRRLVPAVSFHDLVPLGAGVRAQAVEPSGALADDFRFVQNERMIHVLNAPSPAATASLSIGQTIAAMAMQSFALAGADPGLASLRRS